MTQYNKNSQFLCMQTTMHLFEIGPVYKFQPIQMLRNEKQYKKGKLFKYLHVGQI